jgi:DUF971 family protein
MNSLQPASIDLKKDRGLTIEWHDGSSSYYSIRVPPQDLPLGRHAPAPRRDGQANPLDRAARRAARRRPVVATHAELVGNYAIRIRFSDGHSTGIYSWAYLREIDPAQQKPGEGPDQSEPRA